MRLRMNQKVKRNMKGIIFGTPLHKLRQQKNSNSNIIKQIQNTILIPTKRILNQSLIKLYQKGMKQDRKENEKFRRNQKTVLEYFLFPVYLYLLCSLSFIYCFVFGVKNIVRIDEGYNSIIQTSIILTNMGCHG